MKVEAKENHFKLVSLYMATFSANIQKRIREITGYTVHSPLNPGGSGSGGR
jgi:hypothetical protein